MEGRLRWTPRPRVARSDEAPESPHDKAAGTPSLTFSTSRGRATPGRQGIPYPGPFYVCVGPSKLHLAARVVDALRQNQNRQRRRRRADETDVGMTGVRRVREQRAAVRADRSVVMIVPRAVAVVVRMVRMGMPVVMALPFVRAGDLVQRVLQKVHALVPGS